MLKKFQVAGKWLLGMAIIVGTVSLVAREEHYASAKYKRACEEHVATVSPSPNEKSDGTNECKNPEDYMPWGYILFWWPEGITTWGLLATLAAIIYQGYWTRRAADATAESANASYGSVTFAEAQWKLMVEEKRARLDLSVQPANLEVQVAGDDLVHLMVNVSVRNIGASKAFIGRTSGTLMAKLRNEALGQYDDYSPLDLPEKAIAPDRPAFPIKVYCFPTATARTFAECLEEGTYTLHFYGFIEYETLGFWRRKEFGYDWKIVDRDGGLGGLYGLSDPYPKTPMAAQNRIAYGYWRLSEDRDRPEYPISGDPENKQEAN